jgi:hypothetical protein
MNIYDLDRPKRGLAVIINNLHSEQKATRNDVAKLEAMFQKIDIQVDPVKINQDKNELSTLAEDLRVKDMKSFNLFFLLVISHGLDGDKIKCSSGAVDIELFVESLVKNQSLTGYPKILIFDCCRGDEPNIGQMKATTSPRIPFGSDIFIGFATTKGYASVTMNTGSPFINAFCNSLEKSFDKEEFITIFQEVQFIVSQEINRIQVPIKESAGVHSILDAVQVPELRSTLRKHLYLFGKGMMNKFNF